MTLLTIVLIDFISWSLRYLNFITVWFLKTGLSNESSKCLLKCIKIELLDYVSTSKVKLKGITEDEMAGWHHRLDGRKSEWTPGVGDGQEGLGCCDSWPRNESDSMELLNWTELNHLPQLTELNIYRWIHMFWLILSTLIIFTYMIINNILIVY